jgi:site-specific DNA recombinase
VKRFAIYARYSTALQKETSVEDQVRVCQQYVERNGGRVTGVYADHAASGSHAVSRLQYQKLIADCRAGLHDATVAEDLDRFSRDGEEHYRLLKAARFYGFELHAVTDGPVTKIHSAVKGLTSELYLDNLADKTRRGQIGALARGRIPGGACYGYHVGDKAGERTIDAAQAAIITRIFQEYATGRSPRSICRDLNAEKVPPPRGSVWRVSCLIGNPARANGILNNSIYVGRFAYNRQRFPKNPDTGKRQARPNSKAEWIWHDFPALRIVTDELWDRVQVRRAQLGGRKLHQCRRPKTLLSGLISCGTCGGPMTKMADYYRCANHKNSATCSNGTGIKVEDIEGRIITAIQGLLRNEELKAEFVKEFHAEIIRLGKLEELQADRRNKRVREIDRALSNIVATIEAGAASEVLIRRLAELEAESIDLRTKPSAAPAMPLVPHAGEIYREKIEKLGTLATGDDASALEIREGIRVCIARITAFEERDESGNVVVEADGDLGPMLALASGTAVSTNVGCGGRI